MLWWQISASARHIRATGNPVSGTVVGVHHKKSIDLVDIEYTGGGGLDNKVELAVWAYGYDVGDDVALYVDPKGGGAVIADAFSSGSYWSAHLAIDLAIGGVLLLLIAVGRVTWGRIRKA
ncbi:hypothetical protein [Micromonospora sp. NBC_01638]|uniref:hypothetical protein n=1 Tax=Micromonospora sp. NBC_01638 TaxID=2975982 RepID=UPI00386A7908|nr:hypothetical protein OG811_23325 [Micromonospora sp. NBC_01638]